MIMPQNFCVIREGYASSRHDDDLGILWNLGGRASNGLERGLKTNYRAAQAARANKHLNLKMLRLCADATAIATARAAHDPLEASILCLEKPC